MLISSSSSSWMVEVRKFRVHSIALHFSAGHFFLDKAALAYKELEDWRIGKVAIIKLRFLHWNRSPAKSYLTSYMSLFT